MTFRELQKTAECTTGYRRFTRRIDYRSLPKKYPAYAAKLNRSVHKSLMFALIASATAVYPTLVSAETPVARTGNFAISGPSPRCDGALDTINSVGDAFADGLTYLGEKAIKTTAGVGLLLTGDPDALIDEVNGAFDDATTAYAAVSEYSPLALMSVVVDVLPDGAVTDFLAKGVEFVDSTQLALVSQLADGANPINLADTVLNDLEDIASDVLKVVENLDDPLSAANEFMKLQNKWTGAGALTYMFTEKDPLTGLKKALTAIHKQVEIVTRYSGGLGAALTPGISIESAILGHVMDESKSYINSLPDGPARRASVALAATFAVAYKSSLSDPNFDANANVSRHPLFLAERRMVDLKWLGDDHNTGGKYDFGLQHPVVENKPGCISLGDKVYPGRGEPDVGPAICGVESGRDKWWSRPIDYKVVWGSNCAGGSHDLSVWQPVCKDGYVSVGFVAHNTPSGVKPLPNAIACLKNDPLILAVEDGQDAALQWVATDENSGAKFDVTFFTRDFLGLPLMHAVNRYISSGDREFVENLRVAVPARGTAPSYEKARCVNFYSEPFYGGWTREMCNLDVRAQIHGPYTAAILQGDGVSSFQCGPEVAGVQLYSSSRGSQIFNCSDGGYLNGFDNVVSSVLTLSSYSTADGRVIKSPQTVANEEAIAQKIERDRLEKIRAAEAAIATVATYTAECEAGDEVSCLYLGYIYQSGTPNIEKDVVAAEYNLRRACDLGEVENGCSTLRTFVAEACGTDSVAEMCTKLGDIYYLDTLPGVAEDYVRARGLYDAACYFMDTADVNACRKYGDMLYQGKGGNVDLERAFMAYRDACQRYNARSCVNTGNFLRSAVFVDQDYDAARQYYQLGCSYGLQEGCDSVIRVNQDQADAEAEAERLAQAAAAVADTDHDGMLDEWELANNFDPLDATDAAEDYDEDGISNKLEHDQGSDPRDTLPETSATTDENGVEVGGGVVETRPPDTGGVPTGVATNSGSESSGGGGGGGVGIFMLTLLTIRQLAYRDLA